MKKHFSCTACGKCCYGLLPLTWKDALSHMNRFPICFVWTPVQQGSKDFNMAIKLGASIKIGNNKMLASLIMPTSFIPSNFPCPALGEDNLCSIHHHKPSRCKTMPFYPYREERFQAELLKPRQGWDCDVSESAPLVFAENKIIKREDFDQEKEELINQISVLRQYSDYMMRSVPAHLNNLIFASMKKDGGQVVTSLSSFLTATRNVDARKIAQLQLPILTAYAEKTAHNPALIDFHKHYVSWAKEMSYLARQENFSHLKNNQLTM